MPALAASDAVRLLRAPAAEYRARVAVAAGASWRDALAIPALLALMLGLLNATAAAGHVTASLVLDEIVCWSFVPALQLITGASLIASAKTRRVTFPRAIELLFAAHGPWSLWLVATTLLQTVYPDPYIVIGSGLVPLTVTAFVLGAFGREVLGLSRREARLRVIAHQAVTVLMIVAYIELATRLSVRIIGALAS
jgi:hypothetical protein